MYVIQIVIITNLLLVQSSGSHVIQHTSDSIHSFKKYAFYSQINYGKYVVYILIQWKQLNRDASEVGILSRLSPD